jgi:uncharacterized protein with NAD-binding domain and iron-sulfur cluster
VVSSGARDLQDLPPAVIARHAADEVASYLPRARSARLVRWRVVKERAATPRFEPATLRLRPPAGTAIPNLALAGDWIDTGLPATLEGAALSGHRAAAAVSAIESAARGL